MIKQLPQQVRQLLAEADGKFSIIPSSEGLLETVDDLVVTLQNSFLPLFTEFRQEGRRLSATFKFWDDFLSNVMLPMKMFVSATRNGTWSVYQSTQAAFLKLLFASNRNNYSRYLPVCLAMMKRLPDEISQAFESGLFAAQLSEGPFK